MKTHILDDNNAPAQYLDGHIHAQENLLPQGTSELILQNIGPRVVAVIGFESIPGISLSNSHKLLRRLGLQKNSLVQKIFPNILRKEHLVWSVTPGKIDDISIDDTNMMESALRDAVKNAEYLLGSSGSIRAFQAVKDRALERPIQHSELYEKLMKILISQGFNTSQIQQFREESQKDIHPWQEIIRNIFQTDEGRKLWRELRPLYLEKKRREEEYELDEFRSIHHRFQSILRTFHPSQLFIGATSDVGRLEIIARHLAKTAGDFDPVFGRDAVQPLNTLENTVSLETLKIVPPANPNI